MKLKSEEIKFILSYIDKLTNDIKYHLDFEIHENVIFDDVRETIFLFKKEIPEMEEGVLFKSGSAVNDANLCISLLKKHLITNGYEEEKLDTNYNNLNKMWTFFKTYIEDIIKERPELLNDKYLITQYDNFEDTEYILNVKLDLNKELKLKYGVDLDLNDFIISFENIKMVIELFYTLLRDKKARYDYTICINDSFAKFGLPYKLYIGNVENMGYTSSYEVKTAINIEQFESKIKHSQKLILSNSLLDKISALKLLVDSLEYLISIQKGTNKAKKKVNLCKKMIFDENSKAYSVIKNELENISNYSNSYFDIRHNEKELEALENPMFVEYLYNRVFSFINLYRLCDSIK